MLVKEIKHHNPSGSYCEAHQHSKLRYATATIQDNKIVQHSLFFKCRDFFCDVALANTLNRNISMYRFTAKPGDCVHDDMGVFLARFDADGEELNNLSTTFVQNIVELLNPAEEAYGLLPTVLSPITNPDNEGRREVAVFADSLWFQTPYLLSYYTLILRAMSYGDRGEGTLNKFLKSQTKEGILKNVTNYEKRLGLGDATLFDVFASGVDQYQLCETPWIPEKVEVDRYRLTSKEVEPNSFGSYTPYMDINELHECTGIQYISSDATGNYSHFVGNYVKDFNNLVNIFKSFNKEKEAAHG